MLRIACLASHKEPSVQATVDAILQGEAAADVGIIISNNATSKALAFGREQSISTAIIPTATDRAFADKMLCRGLLEAAAVLVMSETY